MATVKELEQKIDLLMKQFAGVTASNTPAKKARNAVVAVKPKLYQYTTAGDSLKSGNKRFYTVYATDQASAVDQTGKYAKNCQIVAMIKDGKVKVAQ